MVLKIVCKSILLLIEAALLSWFIIPYPIVCAGNIVGIVVCTVLILVTLFWSRFISLVGKMWSGIPGRCVVILLGSLILFAIIYAIVLSVLMYKAEKNNPDNPKVLIVLGCKVNGENPSKMLRRRLDTAYSVLENNEDTMCVVSGGQGANEKYTEASVMKKYLVEKGIDSNRIIEEDKSVDTDENIKFSMDKIDENGLSHDVSIVTDGFHQYRAKLIADKYGVKNATAYSASTETRFIAIYWVREWLALTKFFIFD